jgi:hypothetical protein
VIPNYKSYKTTRCHIPEDPNLHHRSIPICTVTAVEASELIIGHRQHELNSIISSVVLWKMDQGSREIVDAYLDISYFHTWLGPVSIALSPSIV